MTQDTTPDELLGRVLAREDLHTAGADAYAQKLFEQHGAITSDEEAEELTQQIQKEWGVVDSQVVADAFDKVAAAKAAEANQG